MIQAYGPTAYPRRPAKVGRTIEKWILYLVVLGIAGVSLYWFIVGKGKTLEVKLISKKGTIEYRENSTDGWKTVSNLPFTIKNAMEIRTLADSEGDLTSSEGSRITLGSYSRIVLVKNQGEIDWVQTDGVSHHQVAKSEDRKKYNVSISDGDIEAQGTAFEVKIEDTDTTVLVFNDAVKIRYKDKSVTEIKAGDELSINPVGKRVKPIEDLELREEWTLNNLKEDQANNLPIDNNVLAKAGLPANPVQESENNSETDSQSQKNDTESTVNVNSTDSNNAASGTSQSGQKVSLEAKQSTKGILLNWNKIDGDFESWKIVKGNSADLTYPSDSYRTVSKDETSYLWETGDSGNYYYRICAYDFNKTCSSYSDSVSISFSAGSGETSTTANDSSSNESTSNTSQTQTTTSNTKSGTTTRSLCENSGGHWTKSSSLCKCPPGEAFVASVGRCKKK